MTSPPSSSKIHASPAKPTLAGSSGRTYDAKLVTREMHRLGSLAHAALAPGLAVAASSSSSITLAPAAPTSSSSTADSYWAQLHVHVLPLFNGEALQIPIEDLNTLVRRHIEFVVSKHSRAVSTLETDAEELIYSGMITLNAKLTGIGDSEKLVARVVEIWGFFWDQILPYVEGVLLPLQTDARLISPHRPSKTHRSNSPTLQMTDSSSTPPSSPIDIRALALRAFRDKIIYPIYKRLEVSIAEKQFEESIGHQQPRLRQMLLVLLSHTHRSSPRAQLSLTAPVRPPSPPEIAIRSLLDASCPSFSPFFSFSTYRANGNANGSMNASLNPLRPNGRAAEAGRPPSFLSGGAPRDRRGRVAGKNSKTKPRPGPLLSLEPRRHTGFQEDVSGNEAGEGETEDEAWDGDVFEEEGGEQTPTNGFSSAGVSVTARRRAVVGFHMGRSRSDADRERDWEILESLRSPQVLDVAASSPVDIDADKRGEFLLRGTINGGGILSQNGMPDVEEKFSNGVDNVTPPAEEEASDWDKAQADVERMVGINTIAEALATPTAMTMPTISTIPTQPLAPIVSQLRSR